MKVPPWFISYSQWSDIILADPIEISNIVDPINTVPSEHTAFCFTSQCVHNISNNKGIW